MTITSHFLATRRFTITVDQQIRDGGTVAYQVAGQHFAGLIVVEPWLTDDQAVPTCLWAVNLGDGHALADHRTGLPVARGMTMYGGAGPVDFADPAWAAGLRLHRRADGSASARPQAAADYDLYAVMAVIARLHQQLDYGPLMLAAAKASADRRLRQCVHRMHHTYDLYAECRDDLRQAVALATKLQQLSPLRLLHPGPPSRWHGCVDPDVYLRADDDGDWLTCPSCHQPVARLQGGDSLGSLLDEVAAHRCA